MKTFTFLNDDGEIMESVEADNEEEAKSLYEYSDYFMLEEVEEESQEELLNFLSNK